MGKFTKEIKTTKNKRAVFLDRDGTLNQSIFRNGEFCPPTNLEEFELFPNVIEACNRLKQAGYILVVATNQPDVGRGTMLKTTVEEIHSHMCQIIPIDHIEVCYHPGRGLSDCDCRKPMPGMLIQASNKLDIDLRKSWMIGDRGKDVDCGHSAGCRTILVGDRQNELSITPPHFKAKNLYEAVNIILNNDKLNI